MSFSMSNMQNIMHKQCFFTCSLDSKRLSGILVTVARVMYDIICGIILASKDVVLVNESGAVVKVVESV